MTFDELKDFLDSKAAYYENHSFISTDPIQIPHRFDRKEDIEIAGFLTAVISWGNRQSIISNAEKLMTLMDDSPYEFVMNFSNKQAVGFNGFVHRTFNATDAVYFIRALQHIYLKHGGLEGMFSRYAQPTTLQPAIHELKNVFFQLPHQQRTRKHLADPMKNSAAKRINMFLRWMVRPASGGVDFGLWKSIQTAQLSCPLDVHSGNVARKLGLLSRKQNDAKALFELDQSLQRFDKTDPVKYDFALFGLGIHEKF